MTLAMAAARGIELIIWQKSSSSSRKRKSCQATIESHTAAAGADIGGLKLIEAALPML